MKEGPDIARIGALIGDPARANMLTALVAGKALTASELAAEAGVGAPTASAHLARLEEAGLLARRRQGRHSYFTLADAEVGAVLEAVMGLAARRGLLRSRTGPTDPAMRKARVCYDHLAGDLGVHLYDSLAARRFLSHRAGDLGLSGAGRAFVAGLGIDLARLERGRRPLCRPCLDWSARRTHLAGSLGAALLAHIEAQGWARRRAGSRVVAFTPDGERRFLETFPA
ncbi:MAG: metalloregulator ArsR/SmtB family transcription factor [Alphaproteobacteria bacterium]